MKAEVITFLERFDIEHATPDSQMAYMFNEWDDFEVADKFGKSYGQNEFFENDQRKVINDLIKSNRPKWVIALYNSATIILKRRFQRKILINPTVTYNDLTMCRSLTAIILTASSIKTMKRIMNYSKRSILILRGMVILRV